MKAIRLNRNQGNFFRLWKGLLVFVLLFISQIFNAQAEEGSTAQGIVYVEAGAFIYNAESISNAKIIVSAPKKAKETKSVSKKISIVDTRNSSKDDQKKKLKEISENNAKTQFVFFNSSSEEQLTNSLRERQALVVPVSGSKGFKAILQKDNPSFVRLFYHYLTPYFSIDHLFFNKYILSSQAIRPPPFIV